MATVLNSAGVDRGLGGESVRKRRHLRRTGGRYEGDRLEVENWKQGYT